MKINLTILYGFLLLNMITNKIKCTLNLNIKKPNENNKDYIERAKNEFNEILKKRFYFEGKPIKFKDYENANHIKEVFDHITTSREKIRMRKGKPILKHSIELERIERIHWIEHILTHCENCSNIHKRQQKNNRISIVCEDFLYVIILEKRNNYYLFVTAYPIKKERFKTKFKTL